MMKRVRKWTLEIVALLCGAVVAGPLYLVVVNSFKTQAEAADLKLTLPRTWNIIENYKRVFQEADIPMAFWNSLIITFFGVLFLIVFCSMTAFVIQRRDSTFTRILYQILLVGLILPGSLIATYYVMNFLHLVRTYTGVVLLLVAGNYSFVTYLYVSFLYGVPRELDEAAIIDGVGKYSLFFNIVFPLLLPINASVLILAAFTIWNDFSTPFYFLNTAGRYTLSLSIYLFFGQRSSDWNLVFANIVIVSLPVVVLFMFMQRYIVAGMTAGAVKS